MFFDPVGIDLLTTSDIGRTMLDMSNRTTPNTKRDIQLGIRLDASLVADLDAYVARRLEAEPGLDFTRSDAVRVLLGKALAAEQGGAK